MDAEDAADFSCKNLNMDVDWSTCLATPIAPTVTWQEHLGHATHDIVYIYVQFICLSLQM